MRDYRELQVWHKAHELTIEVYAASRTFPREELFGLTGQMRRAAVSIPSNIAEGYGRKGDVELCRFLHIAAGSCNELSYQILLASELGYLDGVASKRLKEIESEVRKMLVGFIRRIEGGQQPKREPT